MLCEQKDRDDHPQDLHGSYASYFNEIYPNYVAIFDSMNIMTMSFLLYLKTFQAVDALYYYTI